MKLVRFSNVYLLLLCMTIFCSSCGDDTEDGASDNESIPERGFTVNSEVYETPNAFLVYHSVIQYDSETMMDVTKLKNQFSFLFLNGEAISNNGKLLYSTNTTQSTYHNFRDFGGNNVLDDIESVQISTGTFTQSPSTTTRVKISDIPSDLTQDNMTFGDPVFAGINYPLANEDTASFEIKSIDIDHAEMKGTVECEYTISPSIEGAITGKYSGEFQILIE